MIHFCYRHCPLQMPKTPPLISSPTWSTGFPQLSSSWTSHCWWCYHYSIPWYTVYLATLILSTLCGLPFIMILLWKRQVSLRQYTTAQESHTIRKPQIELLIHMHRTFRLMFKKKSFILQNTVRTQREDWISMNSYTEFLHKAWVHPCNAIHIHNALHCWKLLEYNVCGRGTHQVYMHSKITPPLPPSLLLPSRLSWHSKAALSKVCH